MTYYRKGGGYVYVIKHQHGFVKIGESNDPMERLSQLNTATPYKLFLHTTVEVVGDRTAVESELHDLYAEYHRCREWFDLPESVVDRLVRLDSVHESLISEVDGWSPQTLLNMDSQRRRVLRADERDQKFIEEADELAGLVLSGDFPRDNLNPENTAVKRRAEKVDASPAQFIEVVEEVVADE